MGNTELIAVGMFFGVILIVAGPYYLLVARPEAAARAQLKQRLKTGGAPIPTSTTRRASLLKEVERFSTFGPLNAALSSQGSMATRLRQLVHMSGLKTTPGQVVLGSACLALLGYFAVVWVLPQPALGIIAGFLLGFLPLGVLKFLHGRRMNKFEEQFPEAVDLISRALKAGHALPTGLRMASDELPEPVATEFKLLHDQQNYGLPMPEAFKQFAQRVPMVDAQFFVTAVLTQREAGGNLAEVLDNLAAVIRERFKIKRQLRVISAHGRLTGAVLGALPPFLGVYLMITVPEHFQILLDEPEGIRLIILAITLQILGVFAIYKITNVEY